MAQRPRTRLSLRSAGLMVALGVFLVASGVVGLVAVWGRTNAGSGAGSLVRSGAGVAGGGEMPPTPTPVEIGAEGLRGAGRARVQFVSRDDPNRPVGHLGWASLEPTGPGRATVSEPKGEIYLRDGAVIRIAAARGTILYPAGLQQLESGAFEGGVTVELVSRAAGAGGEAGGDAAGGEVMVRVFSPAITFSAVTGEVSTAERFRASGPAFEVAARGLRMIGNQVDGTLGLLEMGPPEYAWIAPHRGGSSPAGSSSGAVARSGAGTVEAAGARRETFYHAVAGDRFRLTRRALAVAADRLEMWVRLVGGALEPGAVGPVGLAGATTEQARGPEGEMPMRPGVVRRERTALMADEPASLFDGLEDPDVFEATWAGMLVVSPRSERPVELEREQVAVALRSGGAGAASGVTLVDESVGAEASAGGFEYGATTRTLRVQPGRGAGGSPRLALRGKGSLLPTGAEINLATGIASLSGSGRLVSADSTEDRPTDLAWGESAEFVFATRDGRMSDTLTDASFQGGVSARDGGASLKAQTANVRFSSYQRPEGPLESVLARVDAKGGVECRDAAGGALSADSIALALEPVGRTAEPRDLAARGNVRAVRGEWSVSAEELDAVLARDERQRVIVTRADAKQAVRVAGPDGLRVGADHLAADVERQIIDLLGARVSIERPEGRITGTQMRLTGDRQELFVFGAGTLAVLGGTPEGHGGVPMVGAGATARETATAEWSKSLAFNNLDGTASCVGDARVVSTPNPIEETVLTSEVINLRFTPADADERVAAGAAITDLLGSPMGGDAGVGASGSARRLLWAEAVGASVEREGGAKASIESTRYAGAARQVERIIFIEGDRLIADEQRGVVEAPSAGRLLIDDRRAAADPAAARPAAAGDAIPADLTGVRGTTLLKWNQRLRYTREDGAIRLLGGVRALHRDAPDQPVLAIDADSATALLRVDSGGVSSLMPGRQTELLSGSFDGRVVVSLPDGASVTAGRAVLDTRSAARGTLEASAAPGEWVVLTTPTSPTATQCRSVIHDLATQQTRIIGPAPVVIPR